MESIKARFATHSVAPAIGLARAFLETRDPDATLAGAHDPALYANSSTGNSVLGEPLATFATAHECEPCGGRVFRGERDWHLHTTSKRHHKAVSRARAAAARAAVAATDVKSQKRPREIDNDDGADGAGVDGKS